LAIHFGPQIVAGHVVRTYLDGLNIDTSGVETLRIRPFRGEVSFGPVTFRGGDAKAGKVGRIGVTIDVTRLLRRKALVRSIVIEGVRFEVRQAEDGSFSLNGIPLSELLAGRSDESTPDMPPPEETLPPAPRAPPRLPPDLRWGAGIDLLEIRDSRIVFIDARGGEAVMHVLDLELGDFRTWAPNRPGRYRLDAKVNDIHLVASGTAKPFADKIETEAEARVTGIEVKKIERFLGPLGFTSRAGVIDLAIGQAWIGVLAEGGVKARLAATGTLSGVDLAHPLFGSGRLAGGTLTLDNVTGSYDASRQTALTGDLGIDLQESALRFGDGSKVAFSRVVFGLPGTRVRTAPGLQPEVQVAPQLRVETLRLDGNHVRGGVGLADIRLSGFSIEGQQPGAPFFVTGRVEAEGIDLVLPQERAVGLAADRAQVDLAKTRLAFLPGGGARIEGGIAFDARQLAISLEGTAEAGRTPPPPSLLEAARFAFSLPALAFDDTLDAGLEVSARDGELSIEALRGSGAGLRGSVDRATLNRASMGVAGAGAPLAASGRLSLDRLDVLIPGEEPMTIAAEHLQADLAETRVPLAPGPGQFEGGLTLDVQRLLFTLQEIGRRGRPPPPLTTAEAVRLKAAVPLGQPRRDPPPRTVGIAGPVVQVDRLLLGGADIQGSIASLDVRLDDIGVETAEPGPPVIASGTVKARDLDLLVPGVDAIGIEARAFDADLTGTRYAFPRQRVLIEGGYKLDTKDFVLRLYGQAEEGRPANPPKRIAAARFAGELSRHLVDERRRTSVRVVVSSPKLALDRFRMEESMASGALVRLGPSDLALRGTEVDVNHGSPRLEVAVRGGVTAPDVSLITLPPGGRMGMQGEVAGLDVDLRRLGYHREAGIHGVSVEGRIGLRALEGRLPPRLQGGPSDRLALEGLRVDIAEADVVKGGDEPAWRARVDLALKSLAASLHQPMPLTAALEEISATGLAASSVGEYAADEVTLGRLDASLVGAGAADPPPAEPRAATEAQPWPPEDLPAVRIGRLALLHGGRIAFRDSRVSPAVNTTLTLDGLSLANIDTTDPAARTRLRLDGRLDGAPLGVGGWAEPFHTRPSFALEARFADLPLPVLSPYLAPRLGLDFRRGTLNLGVDAAATAGQLDGRIRARMMGVRVADRPNAAQVEFARSLGVPLSTLFRLMEDGDGGIDLTLPVHGDLASPEFGWSGAMWSLLPRALRAFVTSPVRFVSSATSLAAAARERQAVAAASPPPVEPATATFIPVAAQPAGD
jgi:hypothetical protein